MKPLAWSNKNPKDWGKSGAGLFITCGSKVLLVRRSGYVSDPFTWGIPGGGLERGDIHAGRAYPGLQSNLRTYLAAAVREAQEELGSVPPFDIKDTWELTIGGFCYRTFHASVSRSACKRWTIRLNNEHTDFKWFDFTALPEPLHFGVRAIVKAQPWLGVSKTEVRLLHDLEANTPMFHGSTLKNLKSILKKGLVPSGGQSPHATKSPSALFFTPDIDLATMYSTAGSGNDVVIIEMLSGSIGELEPDWDDIGEHVADELSELNREIGMQLRVGQRLSSVTAEKVQDFLEHFSPEAAVTRLTVLYSPERQPVLAAEPLVAYEVPSQSSFAFHALLDEYGHDVVSDQDGVYVLKPQYLCHCKVMPRAIRRVWVSPSIMARRAATHAPGADSRQATDFSQLRLPSNHQIVSEANMGNLGAIGQEGGKVITALSEEDPDEPVSPQVLDQIAYAITHNPSGLDRLGEFVDFKHFALVGLDTERAFALASRSTK